MEATRILITQEELSWVKTLMAEKERLEKQISEKKFELKTLLEAGIPIEEGMFKAILREGKRTPKWREIVARLKGEGYCQNVITHTKPGASYVEVR